MLHQLTDMLFQSCKGAVLLLDWGGVCGSSLMSTTSQDIMLQLIYKMTQKD